MRIGHAIGGFGGLLVISALGSVPLHLSTIVVDLLAGLDGVGRIRANAVVSAFFFGQLATVLWLFASPRNLCGRDILSSAWAMVALLLVSTLAIQTAVLLELIWAGIGAACGVLISAGFRAAAKAPDARAIFALRLSIAMVISGGLAMFLYWAGQGASYADTMTLTATVCALLIVLFGPTVRDLEFTSHGALSGAAWQPEQPSALFGILMVFLLFAGLVGFLANAGHYISASSGFVGATMLSTGVAKLSVGVALAAAFVMIRVWSAGVTALVSVALMVSIFAMAGSGSFLIITLGFIVFELAFNIKSSVLLGEVSDRLQSILQKSLLFFVMLGSLVGPIAAGVALENGFGAFPVWFGVMAVLAAFAWRVARPPVMIPAE